VISYEKYDAVVADTADPEQRFRVKVKCAALLGTEDVVLNRWVTPKLPWGFVVVPDEGEQIEIEVPTQGDTDEVPGQSFLENLDIRWTGKRYQGPGAYESMFSSSNYGKRRGFVTPRGHILMWDDTEGQEKVNLVWHSADDGFCVLSFDEDGSVVVANKKGSLIYLNAALGETSFVDEHGNSLSSNKDGMKLVDHAGGFVDLDAKNKLIQVMQGTVYLGGLTGTEPGVLAGQLLTHFRAHVHPTGTGPSGPPTETPPLAFDSMKSAVLQLK